MNDDTDFTAYVRSAAQLAGLTLDEERIAAVALHLARSAAIARALDSQPLAPTDEPAELFRPAPFPNQEPSA